MSDLSSAFDVFCVADNPAIIEANLARSPQIASGAVPLSVIWNHRSASEGYALPLATSGKPYCIFVHQDVYLPRGWFDALLVQIRYLAASDPSWAVIGPYGVAADGTHHGHLWDSGLGRLLDAPVTRPVAAASLDEVALIVRRDSGIAFDRALPSYHLYGTDLPLTAAARGLKSYIIDCPLIHNSAPARAVDRGYAAAYRYTARKWRDVLPYPTIILPLTLSPWPLLKRRLRMAYWTRTRSWEGIGRLDDPASKAAELGLERPLA